MAKRSKSGKKDTENGSLLVQLQAVARMARTHTARHLLDTGLYAGQEQIIKLIAEHGSLSSGDIARALGVRPPTVTKSIARLQEQGFVERSTGHPDGRIVQVSLTKAGEKILKKADRAVRKAEKQTLRDLTPKKKKQLRAGIKHLAGNLNTQDKKFKNKTKTNT